MRTALKNNSEVCHIYATQSQDRGHASNIYFEGRDIYSYGPARGQIYIGCHTIDLKEIESVFSNPMRIMQGGVK